MRFLRTVGKLLLATALVIGSAVANISMDAPVLDDDLVNHVNSQQDLWIAGRNPRFEGVSIGEVRGMLRSDISRELRPISSPWSNCGSDSDHLKVSSLTITPSSLATGQPFTISFSGSIDEQVSGGSAAISVQFLGITVFSQNYDLCELIAQGGASCPIPSGPITVTKTETFPSAVPKGSYTGKIVIKDQTGSEVTCLTFSMKVGSPAQLPSSFDSRTQWPGCIHDVRDQQQCGSCWAFSASEVLSDRFCIDSKGQTNVILSPQYLVSCDTSSEGCQGGYLDTTWKFLQKTGLPTDACTPYTSGGGDSGNCPSTCKDGSAPQFYKATNLGSATDAASIAQAIVSGGPVQAAFSVYQDFMHYTSGVYKHVSGSLLGGHAIEIVGFGVTPDNVQYWIVKNSWGTSWGNQGYFWILKGQNECGIESNVYWGDAAVKQDNTTLVGDYPVCDLCTSYYVYNDNPAELCIELQVLSKYFCKEAAPICDGIINKACDYIKSGHCDWKCMFQMVCAEMHVCPMPSKGCC